MAISIMKATLGRLPRYLKYLKSIEDEMPTISATTIAKALELGEVQVRKDLGSVSGKGKPKIGYNTKELIGMLESVLGVDKVNTAVIVGAGRLGRALLNYSGFEKYGLKVIAAFDTVKIDDTVLPMEKFGEFCKKNDVKIGIITVPKASAQDVCDLMLENGIQAIWNFAQTALIVPDNVVVQQENLALSLAYLNYQLKNK
jgi:redox-sensing transcriptional repressor